MKREREACKHTQAAKDKGTSNEKEKGLLDTWEQYYFKKVYPL